MKIVAFAMFLSVLLFPVVTQAATVSGVPRVVDGDTLAFNGERVRIHGINAVESKQQCEQDGQRWACGQAATQAMSRAVGGAPVQCSGKERDAYGRLVAVCWNARGEDLGQRMVEEGWATAYRRYSMDYVEAEGQAKADGVGIWAGEFQDPESYRHGSASSSSSSAAPSAIVGVLTGWLGALPRSPKVPAVTSPSSRTQEREPSRSVSDLALPSDGFPQGDRVQGTPALSGRQFCALAELAGRSCR